MVWKDSDWSREAPDPNRLLQRASRSFGLLPSTWKQAVFLFSRFFQLMCPIYANMPALPSEFLLGYTADGLFEIIMRPSKFFFFSEIFFFQILVLYEFFDRVNSVYRVYFFFFL